MKTNFDQLDGRIRQDNLFNGNLLVAKDSELLYMGSFGHTHDQEQNSLINTDTIFELASVSKQFTAYTTLVAFKIAKADIDHDIRSYLPAFPYKDVTTRSLLNHTSGLPDYFGLLDNHWAKDRIATNHDVLALLAELKPAIHFSPNTEWEYSNTGYVLLASLVEAISGISFSQCIEEHIFKPLGMQNSFIFNRRWKPMTISNYAFGTVYNEAQKMYTYPDHIADFDAVYYLDGIQGDGTVNSTVLDILKWNNEMINTKILDKNLVDLMLTSAQTINNEKTDYGMGWIISDDPATGKIVYHGGSWPGYSTYNSIYLAKGFSIVSLCNQPKNLEIEQQIILALENILFDKPFYSPIR